MLRLKTTLKPAHVFISAPVFIDSLFLLLIFFILNSPWVFQPAIPISLPESMTPLSNYMLPTNKMVIVISSQLDEEGNPVMQFANKPVKLRDLERVFREELRLRRQTINNLSQASANAMPVLIIRADLTTPHGLLSRIRSLARHFGVTTNDALAPQSEN